jgi:hypothetical protein
LRAVGDYFGDDNALYFSWLELYTKALIVATIFGAITMLNQWVPFIGTNPDQRVDHNTLTLHYSVLLSVWSVVFLSVWKRREAEHAFLWGADEVLEGEEPRKQFRGEMKVNIETKVEELVHDWTLAGKLTRLGYQSLSVAVIVACMVITASCAFAAMGLKFRGPKECSMVLTKEELGCTSWVQNSGDLGPQGANVTEVLVDRSTFDFSCCYNTSGVDFRTTAEANEFDSMGTWEKSKWPIMSGVCNLFVISFMGAVYERIAVALNDKENIRTETEYTNGLILKNFAFQFVNNYFVLFYIAYLRQIEFMGTKKECEESCLGELQMQMFVVFTGKTFGLQLVELATPVIKTMIGSLLSIFRLKKLLTDAAHAVEAVALVPVKVVNSVVDVVSPASEDEDFDEKRKLDEQNAAQLRDREESFMKLDHKAMSNFELQTHMENYEEQGTFNDYNEMAIQYGYIALFSPCFPLAPMAAFMNNVTEIRGDAWQLCNVFQRPMARSQANIGAWYTVLNGKVAPVPCLLN